VSDEMLSSRSSKSKLVEVLTRAGKEELSMTFARFSSPRSEEFLDKSSFSPPELPELELAVGREEMLANMFTMLELSSMLLERLEFTVRFPKMEKLDRLLLEVLPSEKLARLLELVARLESVAKWKLLLPIPSKMAKLAAVPHFGWEEELASRSVTLDRFPMLVIDMFPARAARALPSTVELTVNLFKDSVTSDMMGIDIFEEKRGSCSDACKDLTDSGNVEVNVVGTVVGGG